MDVRILDFVPDEHRVRFRVRDRDAIAYWKSDQPPVPGVVDVEIDIPGEYLWDTEVRRVGEETSVGIAELDQGVRVVGEVVDLDHLGILTLRINGSHIMVETLGEPPLGVVGGLVEVCAERIELYPTRI
jgi:hypothetical protein